MIRENLKEQMLDKGFARCFMHLGIGCWVDVKFNNKICEG